MAGVYSVEGKLGTGKTKFAVWRAQQALLEGRRVASNVDLFLQHLTPKQRSTFIRVPDKPTSADLEAIGKGSDGPYREDEFGVLILDELGTWLNSRSFQDKDRAAVLDWLIHARKFRWEVYLLVQDATMIDKQCREALIEYQCKCMRFDKVSIPLVGKPLRDIAMATFGRKAKRVGYLPRMHAVTARVGEGANKVIAERWFYRGDDLHAAYDTEQMFSASYPHGAHTVLPPWDFNPPRGFLVRLVEAWRRSHRRQSLPPRPRPRFVQLLEHLPPDERWRHLQRLHAQGRLWPAQ